MNKTMIAVFDDRAHAKQAVEALFDSGFSQSEVSLMANNVGGEENINPYRHPGAEELAAADPAVETVHVDHSTSATGAGAVTGGVLGGLAGLLLGMGSLAIPGVGQAVVAGPIAAMLAGALGGAIVGGLVGALVQMGVPEDDAHTYAEAVRRGSTIVAVSGPEEKVEVIADIFRRFHPIDIKKRSETWRGNGWDRFDEGSLPLTNDAIVAERTSHVTLQR